MSVGDYLGDKMDCLVKEHFDKIGEAYSEEIAQHVRDHLFEKWWSNAGKWLRPNGSILDVGCGDGTFVHLLRERGMQAYGVDGSDNLITAGEKRYQADAAFLSVGDAQALDYSDATFDNVLLVGVLHHISSCEEQKNAIKECLRVLKKGGYLLIRECNIRNPMFRFYWNYVFPLTAKIDRFGGEDWIDPHALSSWGFSMVDLKYFTFLPNFTPPSMMSSVSRIERLLEASYLKSLSAHYLAVVAK